jgi:hypothetical protein
LLYFVSGPIDKDLIGGIVNNWHLEAFNNSNCNVTVGFKVFSIKDAATLIGSTERVVYPHSHEYITLYTNGCDHTIAQIEYPESSGEVLLTLTGRDKVGKALPGSIFFNNQLIQLENGIV